MLDINKIISQYVDEKMSVYEIAEENKTYGQKIRRLLKKNGVQLRDKSEAQAEALKRGRTEHPTAGKGHTEAAKIKISERTSESWKNLDEATYNARVKKMQEKWESIPVSVREEMRRKAGEAVREAAKDGSKMEIFINETLTKHGFVSIFHKEFKVPGHDFEVDIYLPEVNIAIEIDGPSHFFPIWGEEKLLKHIKADEDKNALLLKSGIKVLRIKNIASSFTEKVKRDTANGVLEGIKRFQTGSEKFIELEIS